MKKRSLLMESPSHLPYLLTIDTTASNSHRNYKSKFPSVDITSSAKSLSKVLIDNDDSHENLSTILKKTFQNNYEAFHKTKRNSIGVSMSKIDLSHKNAHFYLEEPKNSVQMMNTLSNDMLNSKTPKYKRNLNINLEKLSNKKSTLSTNLTYTTSRNSKFTKIPEYIIENRNKINMAIQVKEPLLVLECIYIKKY